MLLFSSAFVSFSGKAIQGNQKHWILNPRIPVMLLLFAVWASEWALRGAVCSRRYWVWLCLIWSEYFPNSLTVSQKLEMETVHWNDQSDSLIIISSFWETAVYSTSFYFVWSVLKFSPIIKWTVTWQNVILIYLMCTTYYKVITLT